MRRSYSVNAEELLRKCGGVTPQMRRSYSANAEFTLKHTHYTWNLSPLPSIFGPAKDPELNFVLRPGPTRSTRTPRYNVKVVKNNTFVVSVQATPTCQSSQ